MQTNKNNVRKNRDHEESQHGAIAAVTDKREASISREVLLALLGDFGFGDEDNQDADGTFE